MWPTELTLLHHPFIHPLEVRDQPKTVGFPAELLLLGDITRRGSALPSPSFIAHSHDMTASNNVPRFPRATCTWPSRIGDLRAGPISNLLFG